MTIFRKIGAILFAFALAGCGQSGPLYLPGNPSEVQVPASQQTQPQTQQTAPTEEDDEEDNDDGG